MKPNSGDGIGGKTSGRPNGSLLREKSAKEKDRMLVKRVQSSSMDP